MERYSTEPIPASPNLVRVGVPHREACSPAPNPAWFGPRRIEEATCETGVPPRTVAPHTPIFDAAAATSDAAFLAAALTAGRPSEDDARSIMEVVIGTDERVRIRKTREAPWRTICSLHIEAGDGSLWRGTGWVAAPGLVITAGHCVFLHRRGGWVRSVTVTPGASGADAPFGTLRATEFRTVSGWIETGEDAFDYGAILMPRPGVLASLGKMRFAEIIGRSIEGYVVNLAGYPGDKPADTMWADSRAVLVADDTHLHYAIDTAGGQSGAPVWVVDQGERFVVGLHTLGSPTVNSAVKMGAAMFDRIANWATA